jgi:NADH:ubiquinone oxidoreductase subunit 5 (subunit L)/multisubunit Na+/H+ antiporter MnhA subunit
VLVGFGFKVAAMPFHAWTPDAYEGAPTPVTALMSTGVKAAAFAAFFRVFVIGFIDAYPHWVDLMALLAVVTMFGANLVALTQGSVKRMLAYSSIAHAGYLLVAMTAANEEGLSAFLFYLLVYTLMTAGAFGVVMANSRGGQERVTLEDYAGYARSRPLMAAAFVVFLLSLAGFPLTAGFIGKLFILRASVEAGQAMLAVLLVLASLISYFYYLRVVIVMYMRPPREQGAPAATALGMPGRVTVVASAAAVILLFFLAYGPRYLAGALNQIRDPDRRTTVGQVFARASDRARRYVLATLAQVATLVALGALVFFAVDLPAPFVLGLILGCLSAIPYIGAVLGGLPAILLAAADPDERVLFTVVAMVVSAQFAEGLLRRHLDPRTVRVGPALVLVVSIIGFRLYNFGGAVYAAIALVFVLALLDSWSAVRPQLEPVLAGREAPEAHPPPH